MKFIIVLVFAAFSCMQGSAQQSSFLQKLPDGQVTTDKDWLKKRPLILPLPENTPVMEMKKRVAVLPLDNMPCFMADNISVRIPNKLVGQSFPMMRNKFDTDNEKN